MGRGRQGNAGIWRLKGDQDSANGLYEEVVDRRAEIEAYSTQPRIFGSMQLALALAHLGRHQEAIELLDRVASVITPNSDAMMWPILPCTRAMVLGLGGNHDGAIAVLGTCMETPQTSPVTAWILHYDPDWDFMRDDPRFVELSTPENLIQ